VETGQQGLRALKEKDIDLIILKLTLPDMNGMEVI